jgi:hypothetical protein
VYGRGTPCGYPACAGYHLRDNQPSLTFELNDLAGTLSAPAITYEYPAVGTQQWSGIPIGTLSRTYHAFNGFHLQAVPYFAGELKGVAMDRKWEDALSPTPFLVPSAVFPASAVLQADAVHMVPQVDEMLTAVSPLSMTSCDEMSRTD